MYFLKSGLVAIIESRSRVLVKKSLGNKKRIVIDSPHKGWNLEKLFVSLGKGGDLAELASESNIPLKDVTILVNRLIDEGIVTKEDGSEQSWYDDLEENIRSKYNTYDNYRASTDKKSVVRVIDFANSGVAKYIQALNIPVITVIEEPNSAHPESGDLHIVIGGVNDLRGLMRVNRALVRLKSPAIYVVYDGETIMIFDVYPFRTPCLEDIMMYFDQNSSTPLFTQSMQFRGSDPPREIIHRSVANNKALGQLVSSLVVYDFIHLQTTGEGLLASRLLTIDSVDLRLGMARLLRNPKCEVCGAINPLPENILGEAY